MEPLMDNQIWASKKLYTQFRMHVCALKPAEELALNTEQLGFEVSIVITNVERGRCLMSYSRRSSYSHKRRRGHGKGFKRCLVETGKEYEVDITETSGKGEGVARMHACMPPGGYGGMTPEY
jgi:predicted RNA-binding protein with TRAM domain